MVILKIYLLKTACHKALHDKAFDIAKSPKYNGYQRDFTSMICKFVDKNSAAIQT